MIPHCRLFHKLKRLADDRFIFMARAGNGTGIPFVWYGQSIPSVWACRFGSDAMRINPLCKNDLRGFGEKMYFPLRTKSVLYGTGRFFTPHWVAAFVRKGYRKRLQKIPFSAYSANAMR